MRRIYLDNAAITPTRKEVMKEMIEYYRPTYGNPSSLSIEGVAAKKAVESARKKIADSLRVHADEIIFTGSGTEANNLAICGTIEGLIKNGKKYEQLHAITSVIEHASVLEVFKEIERRGVKVTYIGVDEKGIVNLKEIKESLKPETVLVSIMYVNNEIGTIQPIREIAKTLRRFKIQDSRLNVVGQARFMNLLFHSDASQAALYLDMQVDKLGVDLLTLDGHKIYGPKGIGTLYVKRGIALSPIIYGGGQEKGLRSATENVPATAGFAKAIELAGLEREKETERLLSLRKYCFDSLEALGMKINGDKISRIANNIHVSVPTIDTEFLVLQLDARGIAVSTKSSCLRDEDESYVLKAIGNKDPKNGIRITLGRDTRKKDIDYLVKVLKSYI